MKWKLPSYRSIAASGVLLAIGTQSVIAATFADSEFVPTNWTSSVAQQSGPPPVSVAAVQLDAGGNPGAYRRLTHQYGGPGSVLSAHINSAAVYLPAASGAIATLSFSFDLLLLDGGDSNAVRYGLLAQQDGNLYLGPSFLTSLAPTTGIWVHRQGSTITASDFAPLAPAAPPIDFSSIASSITFGYYASNGTAASRPTSTLSGIDNWTVTVTPVAVPEPSQILGVFLASVGLTYFRYRNPKR